MAWHPEVLEQFLIQVVILLSATARAADPGMPQVTWVKQGCQDSCGNLTSIPYPFGTREGCYLEKYPFLITCNSTTNTPYLNDGNVEVLNISLTNGTVRVNNDVARGCYDKSGQLTSYNSSFTLGKFHLSHKHNSFITVGCDTCSYIESIGEKYVSGCASVCADAVAIVNGSCSGIGCCQTPIPYHVKDFSITVGSYYNHSHVMDFNPCGYAFVVEDGWYNFSSIDLANLQVQQFPMVLDWAVGNITCEEAKKNKSVYACGQNATCRDSENGSGYLCDCLDGYHGNPYLPIGCQDINECYSDHHDCISPKNCRNTNGSYSCFCPKGHGDGRKNGKGCVEDSLTQITAGVSTSIFVLFVLIAIAYFVVRRGNTNKLKEKHFKENGGLMLQQLISKAAGPEDERAKIFTVDQLKKATNDFNQTKIIGRGGFGTVYKATLDGKEVAIKKSKGLDPDQVEQFINEVTVLSQINHPNVVKLIGCCLETPVPLLVYEFITNNTLHYHLHSEHREHSLSWETRLRIAEDSASALAHMHSDTPIQIIHRDVKAANILLDDDFTAKVSDFGVSRLVPVDQTHLSTIVQGTLGYMDPEYFHSGMLNEKSDVYSFGVVLLELLTGERVLSPNRTEKDKSLAMIFISAMKDDRLFEILDERVKSEGDPEQIKGVAELARRCLGLKGEKRPTMKEVKRILRELRIHKCCNGEVAADAEETDPLLGLPANFNGGCSYSDPQSLHDQEFTQLTSGR